MEHSLSISTFLFQEDWEILQEANGQGAQFEIEKFSSVVEILTYMMVQPASLIVTAIQTREDILKLAELIKKTKAQKLPGAFKFVAVNFSYKREYEVALVKLGIQDVVTPPISVKALRHKIDLWMKNLEAKLPKSQEKKGLSKGNKDKSKEERSLQSFEKVKWISPLTLEDDIWIVKNKMHVKQLLGKWLIKIMGPGPFAGEWELVRGQKKIWKFNLNKESQDFYLGGKGTWCFEGDQRPEFIWKDNLWFFMGKSPSLFYQDESEVIYRFRVENGNLMIPENSIQARTKEQIIVDSFDQELRLRKEQNSGEFEQSFDEDRFLKNLEGNGQTDELNFAPLSGSVESLSFNDLDDILKVSEDQKGEFNFVDHEERNFFDGSIQTQNETKEAPLLSLELDQNKKDEDFKDLELEKEILTEEKIDQILAAGDILETGKFELIFEFEGEEVEVKFEDLFDRMILFQMKKNLWQEGDLLSGMLTLHYLKYQRWIEFRGVVREVKSEKNDQVSLGFEMTEVDTIALKLFLSLVYLRQRNVDLFFKMAYGN